MAMPMPSTVAIAHAVSVRHCTMSAARSLSLLPCSVSTTECAAMLPIHNRNSTATHTKRECRDLCSRLLIHPRAVKPDSHIHSPSSASSRARICKSSQVSGRERRTKSKYDVEFRSIDVVGPGSPNPATAHKRPELGRLISRNGVQH